jgi:phosphodiesterase/alkaline phosphatase D-like protein
VRRVLLTVAITIVVNSLIAFPPAAAQSRAASNGSGRGQIITGPALESATYDTAIIRWTANTGGGTARHYGIVRYGTNPGNLDQTARSPNKRNQSLANMTYRVRMDGLTPGTTYYFTVDVAQADGIGMGLKSRVNRFMTPSLPASNRRRY